MQLHQLIPESHILKAFRQIYWSLFKWKVFATKLSVGRTDSKLVMKAFKELFVRHQTDVLFTCCTLTVCLAKNDLFHFSEVLLLTCKTCRCLKSKYVFLLSFHSFDHHTRLQWNMDFKHIPYSSASQFISVKLQLQGTTAFFPTFFFFLINGIFNATEEISLSVLPWEFLMYKCCCFKFSRTFLRSHINLNA